MSMLARKPMNLSGLVAPAPGGKKSSPDGPEEVRFESLGGAKLLHHVPQKTDKPIDFSAIGGKVVRMMSAYPANARTEASRENEDGSKP
jgi:hypothetical protein